MAGGELATPQKTCETVGTGCGVALGPEFRNCTCTCGTHGCDTAELPIPMLHPMRDVEFAVIVCFVRGDMVEHSKICSEDKFVPQLEGSCDAAHMVCAELNWV